MNKIRNLIQKMKKPKASEVNELEQANSEEFLDETNEVEDQTTSPQNSVVEKEPAPEQDLSNPPEFENDTYTAKVLENTPENVPITLNRDLRISDKDQVYIYFLEEIKLFRKIIDCDSE